MRACRDGRSRARTRRVIELGYMAGTLEVRGVPDDVALAGDACVWDDRSACFRAPANAYAEVVLGLVRAGVEYEDGARDYAELGSRLVRRPAPRDYQVEAVEAWRRQLGRGVVVLPTGSGKSLVALLAIDQKRRSTLVVAPTLDLVRQWYDKLRSAFDCEVGVVGGGDYEVRDLTVTTYDSAYLHMHNLGARFGMLVFDECHHLPSGAFSQAALMSLAPYRLGLTATPERSDGREEDLAVLVGPEAYRRDIVELAGDVLAEYRTETIGVSLSDAERAEYEAERGIYRGFVEANRIRMSRRDGWREFIIRSSQSDEGRRAMQAYRRQRELALGAGAKIECVADLLHRHRVDRALIFTQDNAAAYAIARRFLVPAITHQTRVTERSEILEGFTAGRYRAVVTSKVLNEGVDVPAANVAIVVSGSGSVREHVQRLGRILRPAEGKQAVLYEIVSLDTTETLTSERRRQHGAYE